MAHARTAVRAGLLLAGALLFTMLVPLPAARAQAPCPDAGVQPAAGNGGRIAAAIVCLIGEKRRERGLRPLEGDRRLLRAARRHSADMVRRRYFDHRSPDGGTMTDRARAAMYVPGDRRWRVGENLAWGSGAYGSARHVVSSWMKSPPHRRNILDPHFRHVAVGFASGTPAGRRGATFTLLLGRRWP